MSAATQAGSQATGSPSSIATELATTTVPGGSSERSPPASPQVMNAGIGAGGGTHLFRPIPQRTT
jgi:hypothetical protein